MNTDPVLWLLEAGAITVVVLGVLLLRQWQCNRQLLARMDLIGGLTNHEPGQHDMLAHFNNKLLFKRVYDHAPVGKLIATPDARIIMANPKLTQTLGCEESELIGQKISDFTYREDQAVTRRELERLCSGQVASYQMEKRYVRRDGTLVWVQVNATILRDEHGEPECIVGQVLDIDERRRAMEALKLRENIVNNTGAGVGLTYNGRQLELINPAFALMHGYQPEELQQQDLHQLLTADSLPVFKQMLAQAQTDIHVSGELNALRKGSGSFPVLVNLSVVKDDVGVLQYWIINYQDLTIQKATEASLRIQENRLKEAERLANVGAWEWNAVDNIIWWSDEMYRMTGVEKGHFDTASEHFIRLIHEEDQPLVRDAIRHSVSTGDDFRVEYRLTTPGGQQKSVLSNASVELCESGGFIMRGANLDVTGIRRAEYQLKQSQQRLQTLTNNLPGLVFQARKNIHNQETEFTYTSRRGKDFFGYDDDTATGLNGFLQYVPQPEREHFSQTLTQCGEQETLWDWDGRLQFADGQEKWVQIRAMPRRDGDDIIWEGMVFDISAAKKAEREIVMSRNLLREMAAEMEVIREQERKQIARDIHDELGQVLTALRMDVAVLRLKYPHMGEDYTHTLKNMTDVVDRAIAAVRSVAKNLRPAVLDMGFAAALEWLVSDLAEHTGAECHIHGDYHKPLPDESRMDVVFRLLQESFTNIMRHADATEVNVAFVQQAHQLLITICDNGKGFTPGLRHTKQKSYGLLGMKERCLALGGDISLKSEPGSGTEISISIPVKPHMLADQNDLCLDCG